MLELTTYGDWFAFLNEPLRKLDDDTKEVLLKGRFEPNASWKVLELVSRNLEEMLSAQTEKLLKTLQESMFSECDVDWALMKYDRACRRAMELCNIPHLPEEGTHTLEWDARNYMQEVYRRIRIEYENRVGNDGEISYRIRRLEKCWFAGE